MVAHRVQVASAGQGVCRKLIGSLGFALHHLQRRDCVTRQGVGASYDVYADRCWAVGRMVASHLSCAGFAPAQESWQLRRNGPDGRGALRNSPALHREVVKEKIILDLSVSNEKLEVRCALHTA